MAIAALSYTKLGQIDGNNWWIVSDPNAGPTFDYSDLVGQLVVTGPSTNSTNKNYKGYIKIKYDGKTLVRNQPKKLKIAVKANNSRPAGTRAFFSDNDAFTGSGAANASAIPSYSNTTLPYADAKNANGNDYSGDGFVSGTQTVTFTIDLTNRELSAEFAEHYVYFIGSGASTLWGVNGDVTITLEYDELRSVTVGGDYISSVTGEGSYVPGTQVTVSVSMNSGRKFVSYTNANGTAVSTSVSYTFNMPDNDVTLSVDSRWHTLTVNYYGNGATYCTFEGKQVANPGTAVHTYACASS